ncbi:hypothetical protein EI42_04826 [Thermosporothrix hazakensis]|jgi:hypothetical protein|uniref:Replication initiation factor n=1 Tax=Thermosporothrix hazakensis TaxID=644383 RepID=A0A326UD86_THEHA|nr:hypothetical protein [Thermosporothrix hazakensis]PZW23903.1 hypothetical protein EI42_04826 [Thermosporothrix hazakensis]GCE48499.1 hypothetical protein KTH_33680 [Thermosporothrix hazakensis]
MACRAASLLAGLDTVIVNVKQADENRKPIQSQEIKGEIIEALQVWQQQALNKNEPVPTAWTHEGKTLLMYPRGSATWMYLLKNGDIDLLIGSRLNTGSLARVRFSSEYLWRAGPDIAVAETEVFLTLMFQEMLYLQPSELHLAADVVGLPLSSQNYRKVFVSRARKTSEINRLNEAMYNGHQLETIRFSRHGNAISATIYDKCAEIELHSPGKRWFYDLWKNGGWDGEEKVWRVECRVEREALREMLVQEARIGDIYDALNKVPSIWAYCVGSPGSTEGWLRMVAPNVNDRNKWRWKTADPWKIAVQEAFTRHWRKSDDIAAIQRKRKREANLKRAEAAIAGYITTYAAWDDSVTDDDDASVIFHKLYQQVMQKWENDGVDFQEVRAKKQLLYHEA